MRLFVSSGPPQVTVPGVVGKDKAAASGAIKDAGLNLTQEFVTSTQPKDQVLSQTPNAGAVVDKGTRVTITISKGPQKVAVPDVTNLLKKQATDQLHGAGFKVKTVTQETPDKPEGTVLSQNPPGGAQAIKGSTVTIVVATAPPGGNGPGGSTSTTPSTTPSPSPSPGGTP